MENNKNKLKNLKKKQKKQSNKEKPLNKSQKISIIKRYLDTEFLGNIGFNEMSQKYWVCDALPWNMAENREFTSLDEAHLLQYCQDNNSNENLHKKNQNFDYAFDLYAHQIIVNPIKDYLEGLKWDNKDRIEQIMEYVFMQKYDKFTSLALKTFLVGAVKRIYEPGCQFDYMLVFHAPQGIGKDSFWRKICINPDWYNESTKIHGGFNNTQKNVEQLIGKWICYIPEFEEGTQTAKIETIKSFITTTKDDVRLSYRKDSYQYLRRQVFVTSTNNDQYLCDKENRRFLPIDFNNVPDKKSVYNIRQNLENVMTQEYIELLWAEAVHLYKEDFPTYLTYEMEELADKKRESHIKEDPWDSLINAALDNMKSEGIKDFTYAEIYHKAINPQWNTFQHLDKSISDRLGAIIRKRDDVISISNLYRNNDGEKKRYRGFKLK